MTTIPLLIGEFTPTLKGVMGVDGDALRREDNDSILSPTAREDGIERVARGREGESSQIVDEIAADFSPSFHEWVARFIDKIWMKFYDKIHFHSGDFSLERAEKDWAWF